MDAEIKKSLTDLIDETLMELEELKKSRFSASEIKIEGPGDGIAGKPSDGDLHAKAEDKDEDDKDDDKDMDKAESKNKEADSGKTHREAESVSKAEDKKKDDKDDDKDEPHKDDPKHEEKEKKMAQKLLDMHKDEGKMGYPKGTMAKSDEEISGLMKSYFDERVKPLEDKLEGMMSLIKKIADQPVAPKGATARTIPLMKSAEEVETLSKAQVASKLFDLKKSGSTVDSLDVTKAEMGQDLDVIVRKYKLS